MEGGGREEGGREEGGRGVVSDDLQVSLTEHFGVCFCYVRVPWLCPTCESSDTSARARARHALHTPKTYDGIPGDQFG